MRRPADRSIPYGRCFEATFSPLSHIDFRVRRSCQLSATIQYPMPWLQSPVRPPLSEWRTHPPFGRYRQENQGCCPLYPGVWPRSEEHTSELQSRGHLVCRLLLEKKNSNLLRYE